MLNRTRRFALPGPNAEWPMNVMAELGERMWYLLDFYVNAVGGQLPPADAVGERNHDVNRHVIRPGNAEVARVLMERHARHRHSRPVPSPGADAEAKGA